MKASDFYKKIKKERTFDFAADIRTVRYHFCKNNDLKQADFEFLLKLDSYDLFILPQIYSGQITLSWDRKRWERLLREGWVELWRKRSGAAKNYNVYKTSYKCRRMINNFYKMLCGEMPIPENARSNQLFTKEGAKYMDKKYQTAIRNFNMEMEEIRKNRKK